MRRFVLLNAIGLTAASPFPAAQNPVVRSQSDLAQSRVLLDGLPSKAMWDQSFVTEVIPKLRAEAERIRSRYEVLDPAVALQLRAGLAAIAILQGRARDATALVAEARAAATKPQDRILALLPIDVAAASRPTDRTDCAAGAAHIADLLRSSDAAVMRDTVLGRLSQFETTSAAFLVGLARSRIDQASGEGRGITVLQGLDLANWRVQATILPPCRTAYSAAMRAWLAEPRNRPTDIWTRRQPEPKLFAGAKPVVVAVWDGGLDPPLFPAQLAIDPAEPMDGRDNDGNGVADDWNGPTYGNRMEPAPAPLAPVSNELAKQLAFQMVLRKGEMDHPPAMTRRRRRSTDNAHVKRTKLRRNATRCCGMRSAISATARQLLARLRTERHSSGSTTFPLCRSGEIPGRSRSTRSRSTGGLPLSGASTSACGELACGSSTSVGRPRKTSSQRAYATRVEPPIRPRHRRARASCSNMSRRHSDN